jgi:hypothetical protein
MPNSLYMLGEHFKNKGAAAVCRRFRDRGRGTGVSVELGR